MNETFHVAAREMKIGFRNPWAYSFMALFSIFMLSLLLIQSQGYVAGYSGTSGTMLHLTIYLLPLMALLLGSFSLAGEKEEGNWELLSVYPLRTLPYLTGKYIGLSIVLLTIVAAGFGLAGLAGALFGGGFSFDSYVKLLLFAACLSLMFVALALLIGALSRNRWQAMTISVGVWFFAIAAWPSLLVAVLGLLPYMWIKPALTALVFANPAELSRLFTVVKLGGGSTLGPEYYKWMSGIDSPWGTPIFVGAAALWIGVVMAAVYWLWERSRGRG